MDEYNLQLNNVRQQDEIHAQDQQEINLFQMALPREDHVRTGREKLSNHPEKKEWLETFGTTFQERIDDKTRREKKKNRRSRLYVKAENEALLNKTESVYAGKLTSNLNRFLPAGINPLQADARDVAQFMIYGGEDAMRNKDIAKLYFSATGTEDEKKASRLLALTEMARILLAVDISRLHLESEQEIANHATVLEQLTGQVSAFDRLADENNYFNTLSPDARKTLNKKLKSLRAISAYYVAEKELIKDPLYRDHYNDELTCDIDGNASPAQRAFAEKMMRTFVLGKIMMKLNGVSERSINKHRTLPLTNAAATELYQNTVREYGKAQKQTELVRADAVRVKREKKTGVDKLTLDDFFSLITDKEEGDICFDKKGLYATDSVSADMTVQNYFMKQKLLALITEHMHIEPGSADDLRLRLTIGLSKTVTDREKAAPLGREELRIALSYMNQKTSEIEKIDRQGDQAPPVKKAIAHAVKEKIGGGYDEQELAHANKVQAVALREELERILKKGRQLGIPLPSVSTSKLDALVKKNISVVRDEIFRQVENVHRMLTNLSGGKEADIRKLLTNKKTAVVDHISALVISKFTATAETSKAAAELLLTQYTRKLALDLAGGNLAKSADVLQVGNLATGGSNGLEQEVRDRMGTCRAWRGKDQQVRRGTTKLVSLCNKLEEISSLEERALDEGLNPDEASRLIRLSRDVERMLAADNTRVIDGNQNEQYGLMKLVANQLSGTRFKQGFADAMKRFRDSEAHPERNMGFTSCAKRLAKATLKKVIAKQPQDNIANPAPDFDIRKEFQKTDRVQKYLNYFKGTKLKVAQFLVKDVSSAPFMKDSKKKAAMTQELMHLRSVLMQMEKIAATKVTIAGVPVQLVLDNTTLEITIDNRSLMLPYNSAYLADRIDSDICEHTEDFGNQNVLTVLQSLRKPDGEMNTGDVGRLRQRCLSILKRETGKNAGYFSNVSYQKLFEYATAVLSGQINKKQIMREIDTLENALVERVNGAEALAFLQRTEKNVLVRTDMRGKVEIKKEAAPVNDQGWSPEEEKVKNFIADMIFGEESWDTTDKYVDETRTKTKNRSAQKKNRIFDMLMPDMIRGNNNLDAFILMINKPELIRQTVKKLALPGDDNKNENAGGIAGLKETIISQLEEIVNDENLDEIRRAEGNFFTSKESVQKGLLSAGFMLKKNELMAKMEKADRSIDTNIRKASISLQKMIDKSVNSMFDDTEITVDQLQDPTEQGIDLEEQKRRYNKLMEIGKNLDAGFEHLMSVMVRDDPFGPFKSAANRFIDLNNVWTHVRNLVEANQNKKTNLRQNNPGHGGMILNEIIQDATKGKKGQGKFTKLVLKNYFVHMNHEDQRKMFASAVRGLGVKKAPQEFQTPEEQKKYEQALEGSFLGGLFKGAGPLLQKMLQGLPDTSLPDKLKLAVKDMKSNLSPIPEQVVSAELFSLIQRSHGKLTKLEVSKSLGAASVGQAFLCKAFGPNLPAEGKNVVVKILRPDARNRMEREKLVMRECARMTDTTGGMLSTYEGQLKRFDEEVDLTIEAKNVLAGQIYDKGDKTVQSMKLSDLAEPTENAMIVEMAPGTTVDKYMEEIDQKKDELLSKFYRRLMDGSVNKNGLKLTPENVSDRAKTREKLMEMKQSLEKRQLHIVKLAEKWVKEGIYGAGFYHGDLHAGNIMINDDQATVIDFGNCTQLTRNQQDKIMLMMTSASVKDANGFLHGFHQLLENTPEDYYQAHRAELLSTFEQVMALGTEQDVGQRILAALIKAQELGFEMPAAVFNFSQAQQRLHNTIEGMNKKLKELHQTIIEFDLMDVTDTQEPILNIMRDERVNAGGQDNRIVGLNVIYGTCNPNPRGILVDYNALSPEEFHKRYLESDALPLDVSKGIEDSVRRLKIDLGHIQQDPTNYLLRRGAGMLLDSLKQNYINPFRKKLSPYLREEEATQMNSELVYQPTNPEGFAEYIQNLEKWHTRAKEIAAREKPELKAAVEALNEVKAHPENFTQEDIAARDQQLLRAYKKELQRGPKSFYSIAIEPIKNALYKKANPARDAFAIASMTASLDTMFKDEKHRGPELKAAYDHFRQLQDSAGDYADQTNTARDAFIALLSEITQAKLKELIEQEQNQANEEPHPKSFFDMMGEVLNHNRLASFKRLGIINTGKLIFSGKVGFKDAMMALFS